MRAPAKSPLVGGPFWVRRRSLLFKTLLLAILVVWPLLYSNGYTMRIMTTGGLFTMLTVAVVVILGQAGQLRSLTRLSMVSAPTRLRSLP